MESIYTQNLQQARGVLSW